MAIDYAAAILTVLSAAQRFGTGKVGRFFGPITLMWFIVLTVAGLAQVLSGPGVLRGRCSLRRSSPIDRAPPFSMGIRSMSTD